MCRLTLIFDVMLYGFQMYISYGRMQSTVIISLFLAIIV